MNRFRTAPACSLFTIFILAIIAGCSSGAQRVEPTGRFEGAAATSVNQPEGQEQPAAADSPRDKLIAALSEIVKLCELDIRTAQLRNRTGDGKIEHVARAELEFARARLEFARDNRPAMIEHLRMRIDWLEEEYVQLELLRNAGRVGDADLNACREQILEAKIDLYTAQLGQEPDWR